MRNRFMVAVAVLGGVLVVGSIVSPLTVQGQSGAKSPRTPWGEPDLQGIWTTNEMHGIPVERPEALLGRDTLSPDEANARRERTTQGTVSAEGIGNYDRAFRDTAIGFTKQRISQQASLIVDPLDGKFPPLTAEAAKRRAGMGRERRRPADWTELGAWGRCITRGALTVVEPSGYNNGVQIVQGPGTVSLQKEMIHESRVVPINAGPHPGPKVRTWAGVPRGRWEGETLVVEIKNFDGRAPLFGATKDAVLVERFTRLGPDELEYRFTVTDPATWTRPWTGRMTLSLDAGQYELVEYACHEANYSMTNSLSAARTEEKAEAAAKKKPVTR